MEPVRKQQRGFTMVEMMVSLTILAMLMTAVAFAFDAAVTNFQVNQDIYETVNRARQSLLRITTDLRTASAVALIGGGDPDNSQVSLVTSSGNDVTYRFNSADNTLYYDDNDSGNSYTLCDNVSAMTFDRTPTVVDPTAIQDVRIVITVTDDSGSIEQTLAAAALVRKNL